jgi:hypothetical protein
MSVPSLSLSLSLSLARSRSCLWLVQDELITIESQDNYKESLSPKINPNLTLEEVQSRMVIRPVIEVKETCSRSKEDPLYK